MCRGLLELVAELGRSMLRPTRRGDRECFVRITSYNC